MIFPMMTVAESAWQSKRLGYARRQPFGSDRIIAAATRVSASPPTTARIIVDGSGTFGITTGSNTLTKDGPVPWVLLERIVRFPVTGSIVKIAADESAASTIVPLASVVSPYASSEPQTGPEPTVAFEITVRSPVVGSTR